MYVGNQNRPKGLHKQSSCEYSADDTKLLVQVAPHWLKDLAPGLAAMLAAAAAAGVAVRVGGIAAAPLAAALRNS